MSEHTLQALLARMRDKPVTLGWGAIAAFGRDRINHLLRHQYVSGLSDFRLMPPFSGTVSLTDEQSMLATFRNLTFGAPQISFEPAALPMARVRLSVGVIGGSFSLVQNLMDSMPRLLTCFDFSEADGFTLAMDLDLSTLVGDVDHRGRFVLDLEKGEKPLCNVLVEERAQKTMGALLLDFIKGQPRSRRIFEMGLMDLNGYNPLSPREFHVYTQPAPGSTDGDGALLLFTRLKGIDSNGGEPAHNDDFPYLIPSDMSKGGEPLYNASLVLNAELREWVGERPLEMIERLGFPARNLFSETADGRHEPHDLLVLGNIQPAQQSAVIEPLLGAVKPGQERQFRVRAADGSLVTDVQWSTRSLGSPISAGSISSSGLYTAPAEKRMGQDSVPAVVTAKYRIDGQPHESSAMVLGRFELMSVQPRAQSLLSGREPVDIHVSSQSGGELEWTLLAPGIGSLQVQGPGHAVYTPPDKVDTLINVQKIQCRDKLSGETIESTMIVLGGSPGALVEPVYVPSVARGQTASFSTDIEAQYQRWSVIGEGSVDAQGVFTPPDQATSVISLVLCQLVYDDRVLATGYAVVQLSARKELPPWSQLETFKIRAPNNLTRAYANGYQQIPLVVEVETTTVDFDGEKYEVPLDDAEVASIRLVDMYTGDDIGFLADAQEGIEPGSGQVSFTHKYANRFALFPATAAGPLQRQPVPVPRNGKTRYRELYLHTTVRDTEKFFVRFTDKFGGIWESTDKGVEDTSIELTGVPPPFVDPVVGPGHDFDIVRDRVWQGPPGGDDPGSDDDFTYYMDSLDYWYINYQSLGRPVPFATLQIEENCSTMQWESEQMAETFFSYTGYAFYPYPFSGYDEPPPRLSFDTYFQRLGREALGTPIREEFEGDFTPSPGQLLVSNHRVADMRYWYDDMAEGDPNKRFREKLDKPVIFVLLDVYGNRHRLAVGYESPTEEDSRNTLVLKIQ